MQRYVLKGINILLKSRRIPVLDMVRYREIFTFPVRDYYKAAGFDFEHEPFEVPAEEFIVQYKRLLPLAGLFHDVYETLQHFRQLGYRQYIVSAMEQHALELSVSERGIRPFFEAVWGIKNNLAYSKVHRAKQLISHFEIGAPKTLMVGDTLHDAEVAQELGVDIIFITRGHQNAQRLSLNGNLLLPDLTALVEFISSPQPL
jgi:phosphoglycolate phosphatase